MLHAATAPDPKGLAQALNDSVMGPILDSVADVLVAVVPFVAALFAIGFVWALVNRAVGARRVGRTSVGDSEHRARADAIYGSASKRQRRNIERARRGGVSRASDGRVVDPADPWVL